MRDILALIIANCHRLASNSHHSTIYPESDPFDTQTSKDGMFLRDTDERLSDEEIIDV